MYTSFSALCLDEFSCLPSGPFFEIQSVVDGKLSNLVPCEVLDSPRGVIRIPS